MPRSHNLIFDFGNVVVRWDPRRVYRSHFDSDAAIDQFLEEIGFTDWNLEQDRGRPWNDAVAELSSRFPNRADLIRAYHERWEESIAGPIEGTVRILERLHERGHRLFGLSNWSSEKFYLTRDRYPFFGLFADIVLSGEVRLVKPDPRIFEILLAKIGKPADQCVFIDDSAVNTRAASKLGFDTIVFSSPEQLEKDLIARGILE